VRCLRRATSAGLLWGGTKFRLNRKIVNGKPEVDAVVAKALGLKES